MTGDNNIISIVGGVYCTEHIRFPLLRTHLQASSTSLFLPNGFQLREWQHWRGVWRVQLREWEQQNQHQSHGKHQQKTSPATRTHMEKIWKRTRVFIVRRRRPRCGDCLPYWNAHHRYWISRKFPCTCSGAIYSILLFRAALSKHDITLLFFFLLLRIRRYLFDQTSRGGGFHGDVVWNSLVLSSKWLRQCIERNW